MATGIVVMTDSKPNEPVELVNMQLATAVVAPAPAVAAARNDEPPPPEPFEYVPQP